MEATGLSGTVEASLGRICLRWTAFDEINDSVILKQLEGGVNVVA